MEEALRHSKENNCSDLKISFLLDYTRGSRGRRLQHDLWADVGPRCQRSPYSLVMRLCCRAGQLEDHAPSSVAALPFSDAGLSVPHSGPEGPAATSGPAALQRDHRRAAHQSLPDWRQHHHQRVCKVYCLGSCPPNQFAPPPKAESSCFQCLKMFSVDFN